MRIAIIGGGVSGLVTAHQLAPRHEITANAHPGGHTNTVRVDTDDATHFVDTGFIVFNDPNYPRFQRLLGRLGVAHQPSETSFSVRMAPPHGRRPRALQPRRPPAAGTRRRGPVARPLALSSAATRARSWIA
jgi:phytoene dehydrogenase-like protein